MTDPTCGIGVSDLNSEPHCADKATYARIFILVNKINDGTTQAANICVDKIKSSFQDLGWHHEIVLLVPPDQQKEANLRFGHLADNIVCGNLGSVQVKSLATQRITHSATVDLDCCFDSIQWKWLSDSSRDADVASCFENGKLKGRWFSRLAQTLASLVSRIALGTRKNDLRPGVVMFKPSVFDSDAEDGVEFHSPQELIAVAHLDGKSVFEAELNVPGPRSVRTASLRWAATSLTRDARFWWNQVAFPSTPSREIPVDSRSHVKRGIAVGLFTVAIACLLCANLGYPLFEPDEARNAQLAVNIHESGEWMSLSLFGKPYWDKPPLQAWMTATSYHLFGANEFATRLPCAVASLMTLLTVLLLGGKLQGFRAGLISAILLLLCCGFLIVGRYVTMDATLTFLSTLMFLATILGVRDGRISRFWMMVAGIACGFGLLTKGPIIMILVLPPILVAGWLEKKVFFKKPAFWLYAGIPAFCISAPWFISTAIAHPDFLLYFFWKHNVVRFTSGFNHEHPWWFYLPVIFLMMHPASFLLPQLVRQVFAQTRVQKRTRHPEFGLFVLYSAWIIGFFSLSGSKLPTYILPAVPVLCLLLGRMLEQVIFATKPTTQLAKWKNSVLYRAACSSLLLFAVAAGVLIFVFDSTHPMFLSMVSVTFVIAFYLCVVVCRRGDDGVKSWVAAGAISVAFIILVVGQLLPKISETRSIHTAITQLSEEQHYFSDAPIVFLGRPPYAYSICLPNKEILHFQPHREQEVLACLAQFRTAIVVASKNDIVNLRNHSTESISLHKEKTHRKLYTARIKKANNQRNAKKGTAEPKVRTAAGSEEIR